MCAFNLRWKPCLSSFWGLKEVLTLVLVVKCKLLWQGGEDLPRVDALHSGTGYQFSPHHWQAVLFCISLRYLGSPPKLASSCLGRFPTSAQSCCIPCFFLFWRWKCSTSTPVGQHQALVQAVRSSQLLEETTNTLILFSVLREQHPRPMCYLPIKVLISVVALWSYCS